MRFRLSPSVLLYPGQDNWRPDIDGLRGLAILFAAGFHLFPEVFAGGAVGVDIFFVISGFLITDLLLRRHRKAGSATRTLADFYLRRILRLFPALVPVLATSIVMGWFLLDGDGYARLGKYTAASAGFVANLVLRDEKSGYFTREVHENPLIHLWSLGIEEQFYLLWPVILLILARMCRSPGAAGLFPLVILATGLLSLGIGLLTNYVTGTPLDVFYLPQTRFWELLAGAVLAARSGPAPGDPVHFSGGRLSSCAGMLLIAASFLWVQDERNFILQTIPAVAGAALLIGSGPYAPGNRLFSFRPLVWLGLVSYPLYLWHWMLLSTLFLATGKEVALTGRLLAGAVSLLFAILTWLLLERPVRHGRWRRTKATILVVMMIALGTGGYGIFRSGGVPWRFPPELATPAGFFDWLDGTRNERCFFEERFPFTDFAPECIETTRPVVALWGDSNAASLYPGLRRLQKDRPFGLVQMTVATCPPVFRIPAGKSLGGQDRCPELNRKILDILVRIRPDVVLLHAEWIYTRCCVGNMKRQSFDSGALAETFPEALAHIRAQLPGARIIVLGPVPRWAISPHHMLVMLQGQKPGGLLASPPDRVRLSNPMAQTDIFLRETAMRLGAIHVSAYDTMCNDRGCLALTPGEDGRRMLTGIDATHLTPDGAWVIIDRLRSLLAGPEGAPQEGAPER